MTLGEFINSYQYNDGQRIWISIVNNDNQPDYVHNFELSIETENLWSENFRNNKITADKEVNYFSFKDNDLFIHLK